MAAEARWIDRVRLLDDAPFDPSAGATSAFDLLELDGLVKLAASSVLESAGYPMVIHVCGAWGQGKTSYCRMLEQALSTTQSPVASASCGWYVASDNGGDPALAMLFAALHTIHQGDLEATLAGLRRFGPSASGQSDPARMESFRRWVARELGWERSSATSAELELEFPAGAPGDEPSALLLGPDHVPRDQPRATEKKKFKIESPRQRIAVLFVDDLDRCAPEKVKNVFAAIRELCVCRGLMFVVAADRGVLEAAFERAVEELGASGRRKAADAMEKYIRHQVDLPGLQIASSQLSTQLVRLQHKLFTSGTPAYLLRGPRPLMEDGIAYLWATTLKSALTLRSLKRLLNEFAVEMARIADRLELREADFSTATDPDLIWTDERRKRAEPSYDRHASAGFHDPEGRRDVFANRFLGTLIAITTRTLWPEVAWQLEEGSQQFRERVNALAALGVSPASFSDPLFKAAADAFAPPCERFPKTPDSVRRALCEFLAHVTRIAPQNVAAVPAPAQAPKEDFVPAGGAPVVAMPAARSSKEVTEPMFAEAMALIRRAEVASRLTSIDLSLAAPALQRAWTLIGAHPELTRALRELAARLVDASGWNFGGDDPAVLMRLWRRMGLAADALTACSRLIYDPSNLQNLAEYLRLCADESVFDLQALVVPKDLAMDALRRWPVTLEDPVHLQLLFAACRLSRKYLPIDALPDLLFDLLARMAAQYQQTLDRRWALTIAMTVTHLGRQREDHMDWLASDLEMRRLQDSAPFRVTHLVADWFCVRESTDNKSRAYTLYIRLIAEGCITARGLHNVANLEAVRFPARPLAGRLWEIAYRAGYRVPPLTRAFSAYLGQHNHSYQGILVAEAKDLPPDFHPFGFDPPDTILRPEDPDDDE